MPERDRSRGHGPAACALLAGLLAASLAGCDRAPARPEAPADAGLQYDQLEKLRGYSSVLLGFDLAALRHSYVELDVQHAKPDDAAYLDSGTLENALTDLRRARAMPAALAGIDAAADRFLPALQRLTNRAKGLNSYFTMRGHLADGFARARREDPLLLADYDAAIAARAPFAALVDRAQGAADAALLPRLKAEGRMADYYDILIAARARRLHAMMDAPDPFRDPASAAEADRIVDGVAPLLDRARAARAARKDPDALDNGVVSSAEQMVGAYRDLRRSGKELDRDHLKQSVEGVILAAS